MNLVLFIAIGSIAGVLAGRVVAGHRYGVLADICVGVIGAFLVRVRSPPPPRALAAVVW